MPKKKNQTHYIVIEETDECGFICVDLDHAERQIDHLLNMDYELSDIRIFEAKELHIKKEVKFKIEIYR